MIVNAEDITKIASDVIEIIEKRGFTLAQMEALEEFIRRIIAKLDSEGYFNHDHEDGEQVPFVAERDENSAYKK